MEACKRGCLEKVRVSRSGKNNSRQQHHGELHREHLLKEYQRENCRYKSSMQRTEDDDIDDTSKEEE